MSYIKGLIEDMKEIDSLTDEMLELDLPWNERESMLHGDMVDAIDAYLTFLRQYVADGSRYERLQRPSAPRSKQSSGGAAEKKTTGSSQRKSASGRSGGKRTQPKGGRKGSAQNKPKVNGKKR